MICRYAFPTKVQPVDKRPHSLPVNRHYKFNFFCRLALHSQHPQGSRHHERMVFWTVHRISPPSFSAPITITLLSLLFELSQCPVFEHTLWSVWDVTRFGIPIPLLKNTFFFLDSHFVVRAIYLLSLFQPLPRWWKTMCSPKETSQANYT